MEVLQNVGILYSARSRRFYIDEAKKTGQVYPFLGPEGQLTWLVGQNAYLAVNGLSNMLRRWGIKFDVLGEGSLNESVLRYYNFIFIPNAAQLEEKTIYQLRGWASGGKKLIISGHSNLPDALLGIEFKMTYLPSKPVWIHWADSLSFEPGSRTHLVHPPQYSIPKVRKNRFSVSLGNLVEFQKNEVPAEGGEIVGDGAIVSEPSIYFVPPIFEFIGGLLQGHIDIEEMRPYLKQKADFFIEELILYIEKILKSYGCKSMWDTRLRIWGGYDHVFVLRHDVDHSRDLSYLEYEKKHAIPATYSILKDKNWKFWLAKTQGIPCFERAYHFSTNKEGVIKKCLHPHEFIEDPKAVLGKGLALQIENTQKKFRIPFKTLQRHGPFFYYPEFIASLDHVFEKFPHLLGSGTLFRYTCFRYHSSETLFKKYVVPEPHVSVSFWFPFKMTISTVDGQRLLRGWESPHFVEPDDVMIEHVFENSTRVENGVYTFGFHPAHAQRATFREEGNFPLYLRSIKKARERGWWFANLEMVYHRLNQWETLKFRYEEEKMMILNPSDEVFYDLFIQDGSKRVHVKEVPPNKWLLLERKG